MKTNLLIIAIVTIAFLLGECKTKEYFDIKFKVLPESQTAVIVPENMNTAAGIIRKRLINSFGIPQENIKLDVNENQISLTISNADTGKIALIKKVITGNARLEFYETYENSEIIGYLSKADSLLRVMFTPGSALKEKEQPDPDLSGKNTIKNAVFDSRKQFSDQNPLFSLLGPRITATGEPLPSCMIGLADEKDTSVVNRYLKMDRIKELFPKDLKFCWSANPYKYDSSKAMYGLHAIKVSTPGRLAPLDGRSVISAEVITGTDKKDVRIGLTMNPEGAKTWAKITRENIYRCIAVVYNGHVRSYPRVQSEISGGKTEITGDFTIEEATDLVRLLNSGELPFELKTGDIQIIKRE